MGQWDVHLSIVSIGGRSTSRSDENAASVNLSALQWYMKKSAKFYVIKLIHHPLSCYISSKFHYYWRLGKVNLSGASVN